MKGVLESFFRTFHDHGAALPGQTGSIQMLNAPADLDQKQADHKALMNECEDLAPAVIEQLKLEFLRYSEAIAALEKLFSHLNRRTKHRLQGFARIDLWRFPDDASGANWRPIDELRRYPAADVRRALFSHRMETPLERLEKLLRLQPPFAQVPPEAILPFSARLVKKVRHPAPYTIAWTEQGTVFTYRGEVPELARGDGGPFFVKLLPGDLTVAYLHDADTGALLGTLAHVTTPRVGDETAQHEALGELAHYKALVVKPVMARHAPERAAREQNRDLNAAIIAAARTGTELVASAAETKAAARKQSAATQKQNARLAAARALRANATLETL